MSRRAPLLYRIALGLVSPLVLAHLVWKAWRDGGWRYVRERLGIVEPVHPGRWIHCASVGEVQTALPLIDALQQVEAGTILITTNTSTGRRLLADRTASAVEHRYLPLDFGGAVNRFLQQCKPETGWIMETEIWPTLFAACHERRVPLTIINGRLSQRSRDPSNRFVRSLYQHALAHVTVLARGDDDADAFVRLGAPRARTVSVGNLKFASRLSSISDAATAPHAARLIDRPYCIAASTHADEERRIAQYWLASRGDVLLIIVPRHPERGQTLHRELSALNGAGSIGLRSRQEQPGPDDRLYLADTLGELPLWYRHAEAVFVGGSLVDRGGQNMLEPIRDGRAVVVGPDTRNFVDVMTELRRAEAVLEVDSASSVVDFLLAACRNEERIDAQRQRAVALASTLDSRRIVQAYLARLQIIETRP